MLLLLLVDLVVAFAAIFLAFVAIVLAFVAIVLVVPFALFLLLFLLLWVFMHHRYVLYRSGTPILRVLLSVRPTFASGITPTQDRICMPPPMHGPST